MYLESGAVPDASGVLLLGSMDIAETKSQKIRSQTAFSVPTQVKGVLCALSPAGWIAGHTSGNRSPNNMLLRPIQSHFDAFTRIRVVDALATTEYYLFSGRSLRWPYLKL